MGNGQKFNESKPQINCGLHFVQNGSFFGAVGVNKEELVWVKNGTILSRSDYNWKHESCIYGWKEGAAHYFTDSKKEGTVIEDAKPKRSEERRVGKECRL